MSQFLNLIKSVGTGDNLSLLSSLSGPAQEQIKESIGGSLDNLKGAGEAMTESVSTAIEQKAPVMSNSMKTISKVYRWRAVIIIVLLLWAIFMILSRIFMPDEKAKEHIEKTNDLMIGHNGILLLIGYVWFGSLLMITVIPAIFAVTPKLENILGTVNTALTTFTGGN